MLRTFEEKSNFLKFSGKNSEYVRNCSGECRENSGICPESFQKCSGNKYCTQKHKKLYGKYPETVYDLNDIDIVNKNAHGTGAEGIYSSFRKRDELFNLCKFVISMDSMSYFSSVANDYGYNNIFTRWFDKMESTFTKKKNVKVCVIGLSGSGNSKNIVSSLDGARDKGWDSILISGKKSICLPEGIDELCIDCESFHTAELVTLMLFYQLVHDLGHECPTIDKEIRRKSKAPKALRG